MKYWWLGDSWVYGDELDRYIDSQDLDNHTFAGLVSEHFGAECVNLGQCGSSLDDLPLEFYKWHDKISTDDVVFFCLTANHRTSFFDDRNIFKRILPNDSMEFTEHRPHPHGQQWFRYFDSPMQRAYNQDRVCNLLYLWCMHQKIECYFANIFTVQNTKVIDILPDHVWLVDKSSCLAASILPLVHTDELYLEDRAELTNAQWQAQQANVDRYFRPNNVHPNVEGHRAIADTLIKSLESKR